MLLQDKVNEFIDDVSIIKEIAVDVNIVKYDAAAIHMGDQSAKNAAKHAGRLSQGADVAISLVKVGKAFDENTVKGIQVLAQEGARNFIKYSVGEALGKNNPISDFVVTAVIDRGLDELFAYHNANSIFYNPSTQDPEKGVFWNSYYDSNNYEHRKELDTTNNQVRYFIGNELSNSMQFDVT